MRALRFTSLKEQRLWQWTAAVLVAIYASMGVAQSVTAALRERNLLRLSFALVLLVGVSIFVWFWARRRPGWPEIVALIGVGASYLWLMARGITRLEERTHLIEYGVVAALIHAALRERVRNGACPRYLPAAITLGVTIALGVLDECVQALLPNRVFDWFDILFNTLAVLMAVTAAVILGRARSWVEARRIRSPTGS